MQLVWPAARGLFEWPEESLLDSAADEPVGFFDLTVGLWMCYGGITYVDSQILAEFLELLGCEVRPIVRDDAMWYSEAIDDGFEELDCAVS